MIKNADVWLEGQMLLNLCMGILISKFQNSTLYKQLHVLILFVTNEGTF